jgi:hypothetical protein
MKRIGTVGVVVTFVSAAATALAGCCTSPKTYPAAASQEDRPGERSACTVSTPAWPYSVPGG